MKRIRIIQVQIEYRNSSSPVVSIAVECDWFAHESISNCLWQRSVTYTYISQKTGTPMSPKTYIIYDTDIQKKI